MPRERTTWNRNEIARTAGLKVADPYTMNQDHVQQQPAADAYVTGGPSEFAEDVHPSNGTWEAEYAGGQVKRNEIGMPEMRGDTFNHPEKTASEEVLTKKAALCVAIARAILPKTASVTDIEEQSLSFMHLPDAEVMSTYSRLAADDQGKEGQQDQQAKQGQTQEQAQGQQDQQAKQGGQMPPQFKENAEKKKEEAEAKKDQGKDKEAQTQEQAQGQQDQQKQAQQTQLAQLQQQAQQIQQQIAQIQQQAQAQQQAQQMQQQAQGQQPQMQQQAQGQQIQQQAQGQQVQSQAQQVAQAVQQALAQGQDPVMAVQQLMQQQAQGQQQAPVGQDAELIDAMLAQDQIQAPVADMDIQIETPSMDVGEVQLGPEDDVLRQLFAGNAEVRMAQQAQGQQEDQDQGQQGQQKQGMVRNASTRTVGTRPTGGVSQIGGLPSAGSGGGDKLSSLWNSAPDVREAFGLPTNR